MLSLSVGARTKELALRQAIGARRHQVIALVLGEGARLVAIGVAGGVGGALLVGRLLEALLFDVTANDPASLGGAALTFAGVAALACLLPAWRAGRGTCRRRFARIERVGGRALTRDRGRPSMPARTTRGRPRSPDPASAAS